MALKLQETDQMRQHEVLDQAGEKQVDATKRTETREEKMEEKDIDQNKLSVVHETVNKIISNLIDKYERKSSVEEQMERLEMAQIKLEIALETSNKWTITGGPLLRWQKKLKRAAEECDFTLRKCRQRVQEEEEEEQQARNSFFPRRIARATKSLISSMFLGNIDEPTVSAVRRFEWFAEGANGFLRSVELGGTPRRYLFFDPLIGHLLAGETLEYKLVQGSKQHLFWIRPNNIADRGVEAQLIFIYNDVSAPEDFFFLGIMLQISESTNIVGTAIQCLQLFTPYFKSSTTETVRKELTQLPTQDFYWVPRSCSNYWDNIHIIATKWFRPNPQCCKHHSQKVCGSGYMDKIEFPGVSLEPVIGVYLEGQALQYRCNKQSAAVRGKICSPKRPSRLKLGVFLLPHVSSTDLLPATESFAIEVIDGEEQLFCHTNITLEQLNDIILPKAIDSSNRDVEATLHQLLWKSKHEAAFFHVGSARINVLSILSTAMKATLLQQHDLELESQADVISEFLKLWVERSPVLLQFSVLDWIQALLGGAGDFKKERIGRGGTGMCAAEDAERAEEEEERENAAAPAATDPPAPAASFPASASPPQARPAASPRGRRGRSRGGEVFGERAADGAHEQSLPSRRGRHPPHCPRCGAGTRSSGWERAPISPDAFRRAIAVSAAGIVPPAALCSRGERAERRDAQLHCTSNGG
uniref:Uncharacterized protein n=1 Tax=Oryza punctata TaxID=4537 RepID=A0A0E0LGI7_ORYPU